MDSSQWTQGTIQAAENSSPLGIEKKQRPPKEAVLNCPRCNSINTKFCYYNNYSLSQPRYLCKTCRRYWTNGGSLRNVPVGGGSRKNRLSSSKKPAQIHSPPRIPPQDANVQEGQTLNLAFDPSTSLNCLNGVSQFVGFPVRLNIYQNPNNCYSEGLTSSFVNNPMALHEYSNSVFQSSGLIPMQENKPSSIFLSQQVEYRYGNLQGVQDRDLTGSSNIIFPFEGLKANEESDIERVEGEGNGYIRNGTLGGGAPW